MSGDDEQPPIDGLQDLMARYQAGEEAAFGEIYGLLARSVRAYLRTLVPAGTDVEDLVQNAFLELHRARRTYLPGQPVRPWVFAIARHVGLMARRTAGRRARREIQPVDELPEISILPRAAGAVDRVALGHALRRLAEPGREAVWLHHVAGFSFREIAAVQGISITAAKVRAHRALSVLRSLLAGSGSPP